MTNKNHAAAVESLLSEFGPDPAFLSTRGRPIVRFPAGQNFPLDDPAVKPWLKNSIATHTGVIPSSAAVSDAFDLLRTRARTSRTLTPVALRIAADDAGSLFLDLANNRNQIAQVTPHGWSVTSFAPTATFISARGLLPIPAPDPAVPGATLDPLRPLLNCSSENSWNGIVEWLTAALHADRPCPVLILHGPPGSGKTNAARLLRTLIDPNFEPLAILPSRGPALDRYAESNHVLAFDHITRMSDSSTDALCRLSSGAIGPSHPIILTAPRMDATDWQPRADLAARAIAVHLPAIENPRTPQELQAEFEKLRPALLAALLTKCTQPVQNTPRPTADEALRTASAQHDPLYKSILNFMETKEQWTGTATDLFNEICVTASPRALSHRLRILAPTLPLTVEFHRAHQGVRKITMTPVGQDGIPRPVVNRPPTHTDHPVLERAPAQPQASNPDNHLTPTIDHSFEPISPECSHTQD